MVTVSVKILYGSLLQLFITYRSFYCLCFCCLEFPSYCDSLTPLIYYRFIGFTEPILYPNIQNWLVLHNVLHKSWFQSDKENNLVTLICNDEKKGTWTIEISLFLVHFAYATCSDITWQLLQGIRKHI